MKLDEVDDVQRSVKSLCTDSNHELMGNLDSKLEGRRVRVITVDGQEYDFGSYFHGFGKNLVKGSNLHFRKLDDKMIELSFKVNHIYHERLRQIIEGLSGLEQQEQTDFAKKFQAQGMVIDKEAIYTLGKLAIEKSAYKVTFEGVGSLTVGQDHYNNLKDHVKVSLHEGATLESFHHFLSIFGLEDALKKSTEEDFERMKIGILFRTFFPSQAHFLEQDDSFFILSPQQLKQKIIAEVPKMGKIFEEQRVEEHELFPGYVKLGVPVAQKVYLKGGRALTTALTALYMQHTPNQVDPVVNILKNGLFSQEIREKNGIRAQGANGPMHYEGGGAHSIYTKMITQRTVEKQQLLNSFVYESPVRLYISLDALNQGSYQYLSGLNGTREEEKYVTRPTIFDLTKRDPSWLETHEIMLPDRLPPNLIKGMSVKSEEFKRELISRLRQADLIKRDQSGNETIHGVPVNEFIHTGDCITYGVIKHCSPQALVKAGSGPGGSTS